MWPDALRIAKEYLPHQLPFIQEEYEKAELRSGARGVDSFIAQAKEWEQQGDWSRAVQTLLRINNDVTDNEEIIKLSMNKAAELTIKFLLGDEQIVGVVLTTLDETNCHEKAAELLLHLGQTRQAVVALCRAKQWSKAKQIATEYLPEMIPDIEKNYKDSLKSEGRLGELIDVDVITAIDMMIEKDQWEKALETAKQQNYRPLLDKYVAQYAAILAHRQDTDKILSILERYGASGNEANFSIYKMILEQALERQKIVYSEVARVRNIHLEVYNLLKSQNSNYTELFYRYLWALHLLAVRTALEDIGDVAEVPKLCLKQSLSLLRFTDILPPDRIFYEAGTYAKEHGPPYDNLGFLLLNHYLDLVDAIEEESGDMVDYASLEESDIPSEVALPSKQWLESQKHEEIKEWVLAASVDDTSVKKLVYDDRRVFEASLTDNRGNVANPCLITGYPVLTDPVEVGDMFAGREDLNKFLIIIKSNQTDNLLNVQHFVQKWAGAPLSITL